jgi:hypothetical protein
VGQAAKHASPLSKSGARTSFEDERNKDPDFDRRWQEAMVAAADRVIKEMDRRAVDGIEEDVYGSLGQGAGTGVVGKKRVYSDKLLLPLARYRSMSFRKAMSTSLEVTGEIKTDMGLGKLNAKQQELLRQLLEAADDGSA